jgi:SAM-dependent methyltransferase
MPIDRYYIERALLASAADIRGHVLEIKDDTYTRRFGGAKVIKSDVLDIAADNSNATIVGDLADAPHILSGAFDCIVVTQTLHLISDAPAAVQTLHRILRPGGTVLATFPGISQIACDGMNRWRDHWRFTSSSARKLFEDVFGAGNVTVAALGNFCAAVNFLDGRAVEELSARDLDFADPSYELVIFVRAIRTV